MCRFEIFNIKNIRTDLLTTYILPMPITLTRRTAGGAVNILCIFVIKSEATTIRTLYVFKTIERKWKKIYVSATSTSTIPWALLYRTHTLERNRSISREIRLRACTSTFVSASNRRIGVRRNSNNNVILQSMVVGGWTYTRFHRGGFDHV